MANKKIDDLWAKELAGTPEEQWERAQQEIAIAEKIYNDACSAYEMLVEQADGAREAAIDKAVEEADEAYEKATHEQSKKIIAEQKKFFKIRQQYDPIKKAHEASLKKRQKAITAERTRLYSLFRKAMAERDEEKAVKLLKKARILRKKLDEQEKT